ncbi:MAG TPA: hypothetical protein VEY14_03230, partial [Nocardioidaceae bacterium]|nr:hypothetical protein [Nocardioidaceae bacterium]
MLAVATATVLTLGATGAGSSAGAISPDAGGRTTVIGHSATSAAAGLSVSALLPAAAGSAGYCPTSAGTTVVVDFTDLDIAGADVVVRCATGSPSTGLAALKQAGFQTAGTVEEGPLFVCRISGLPSADDPLPIPGDPDYSEQCARTPPFEAHWHYFVAPNGGAWQESGLGAASHTPIPGGFEGWSFQLNRSPNIPPRVDPERPGSGGGGGGS